MNELDTLKTAYSGAVDKLDAYWKGVEATCSAEERQPNETETKTFDKLNGEAEACKATLETATANAKRASVVGAHRAFQTTPDRWVDPVQPTTTPNRAPAKIPATARRSRNIVAFKLAPDPELAAYSFGSFVAATVGGNPVADQWCREHGVYATMSSNVNTAGGFAIPDVFVPDLIRLAELRGVFRREARVVPMTSDTGIWPRRTSGQTAYFVAEGANPTESDVAGDNVSLVAKEAAVMTVVPRNLMEDSMIELGELVATESALAMGTLEDTVGFNGAGTAAHGGIQGVTVKIDNGNHTASVQDAASGNVGATTLDLTDLEATVGSLPIFPGQTPKWFCSKPVYYASMARLMDAAGGNTKDDVAGGTGLQFLGYPVVLTNTMDTTTGTNASTVIILFGDLTQSTLFGDRRQFTIASDGGGKYFQAGTIAIKATARFDVNNHSLGDTSNAGPIVAMKTAAS